mgnify:CR=1 FL=1
MTNNNSQRSNDNQYSNNQHRNRELNGEKQNNEEVDISRLLFLLWRNKLIVISIVITTTVLGGVISWMTVPIYQSAGSMLIEDSEGANPLMSGGDEGIGQLLASTYGIGAGSTIKNELQILESRSLSNKVADKLFRDPIMNNEQMYPILWSDYPNDSTITTKDTVAKRFRERLKVRRVNRDADVVDISFSSPSPLAASKVVNLTMKTYKQISTEQNRRMATSAIEFLNNERGRIKKELEQASERLRSFMNRNQLVQVDEQAKKLIKTISELESKKQEVRGKLVATNSGIESYKKHLGNIKPGLAETYSEGLAPKMRRYQYRLAELETEKMMLLQRNPHLRSKQANSTSLNNLNKNINSLKNRINKQAKKLLNKNDLYLGFLGSLDGELAEDITKINRKLIDLNVQKNQYKAQLSVINKRLSEQRKFFDKLPDDMIQLARLKREVSINEKLYNTVANQYAEMQLWKQTQFGLGRIIDNGFIPNNPVKPQRLLYLLIGFFVGGFISMSYIFGRRFLNTSLDGAEKLENRPYPLLATIPNIQYIIDKKFEGRSKVNVKGKNVSTSLITLLDNISPETESFRRLSNNIIYSDPDKNYQTLMVTSSSKGEGKTTIASNLAVILAEAGKNVALIDVDFRRPMIHKFFGLEQSPGLIEVIFDEVDQDKSIQETVVNNVSIISTGRRPPNPAAVNQSDRLKELIDAMKLKFDHVIMDTAPYGIITDAAPMAKNADGIIVVSKFNDTQEAEIDQTLQKLELINVPVIGTVLNAFDYEKSSDYYYSGNYYRYAYRDYYRYHE